MAPGNSDRNLLFGILALQTDFIHQEALPAALKAWALDKSKPLGQVLVEQGALTADARDVLDALVQKHLQLHEDDAAKSLASVRSAAAFREQLQPITDADVQASLSYIAMPPATSADPYATLPPPMEATASPCETESAQGNRFHVLRSHAKGGLGQVSVAFDEELKREVALKEIQEQHADAPESRARFLREAEITGKLEHPGVVPVYSLGQYPNGRPFYAMRFIQGDSFQEAIEQYHRPQEAGRDPSERAVAFRRMIGRFVEVCNAIAYAHSRGVLHRDLKPDNIMLGPFGETLVVDWGLAKPVDQKEEPALAGEGPSRQATANDSDGTVLVRSAAPVSERAPYELMTLRGHQGIICSVSYSADGRRLASASWDGNVHVWDAQMGQAPRTIQGTGGMLIGVKFAQDGRRLAVGGSNGVLQVWDAVTGQEIRTIRGSQPGCWSLAYSLDGELLALAESYAGKVHIWNATTGRPIRTVPGSIVGTLGVAFSPDHKRLASVGFDKAVKIWDISSGALLFTLTGHSHFTENVVYRPDGLHLASASWDGTVRVWDAVTGKELHTLRGHRDRVFGVAYSADGRRLASSSWDGTVKVWDADSGKELLTLRGHSGIVMSVDFSPDGRRLVSCSGSRDQGEIKIWDLTSLDAKRD